MNDEAARQGRRANSPAADDGSSGRGRFAPPAVVIRFEFESRPSVVAAWSTDADDERMTVWLDAHPEYAELLHRAIELSGEEWAA
jgi:hypothetical protein